MLRFLVMLLFILISGCAGSEYRPSIDMSLLPSAITVGSGKMSEPVYVTIQKTDDKELPAKFSIILTSPSEAEISFYNEKEEKISSIETLPFTYKGDQSTYRFTVKGKLLGSSEMSSYKLFVHVEYKGRQTGKTQELQVIVK